MSYSYKVVYQDVYYDIPHYNELSFGYDYNDAGAITFKYARNGLNVDILRKPYATIITYWNGVEVGNSRFMVMGVKDSYDPSDVYIEIAGRTLHDVFRKTITRNPDAPGDSYRFKGATPGGILDSLFKHAQARGAMQGISWSFTPGLTTKGTSWIKQITIEYKPGTKYLDIIRNLSDQGLIDFDFTGNVFNGYNDSENSVDYTKTLNQIELRAGIDYEEMPSQMSVEDRATYSLIVAEDNLWAESTRISEEVSPYGREEQAISQGGMNDIASIAMVNEARLLETSRTTNEYTRKVIIRDGGPVPGVDYKPGDWIYDRVPNSLPVRYRIVSIAIGVDDRGQAVTAALTLNDRIQEFNMRMARKVDGIVGGASADGSSNGVPVNKEDDKTIPTPPTGLISTSATYNDAAGLTKGAASSTWLAPLTNTDGSTLSDLSHYEIEHQVDGTVQYTSPVAFGPMSENKTLEARFDRRGINTPGWVGADGGGNWSDDAGVVYHAWGDTMFGTLTSDGKRNVTMPRNTMTSFDPSLNNKNLTTYAGVENLLPLAACSGLGGSEWRASNCDVSSTPWAGAYGNVAITLKATTTSNFTAGVYTKLTTPQNNTYYPIRAGKSYRVMAQIDVANKAWTKAWVSIIWLTPEMMNNQASTGISSATVYCDASGVCDQILVAPPKATVAFFAFGCESSKVGTTLRFTRPGLFETTHQMQNWRVPLKSQFAYNEVLNPDGAAVAGKVLNRTNYFNNPSFYNNTTTGTTTTGSAQVARDLQYVQGQADGTPLPNMTNAAALQPWFTALNNVANSPVKMVTIGTSVTSGLTTTNFKNRYQTRLWDYLRGSDYPVAGVPANTATGGYQGVSGYIPGYYNADPYCPSLPGPDGQGSGGVRLSTYGLGGQAISLEGTAYRRFKATFDAATFYYFVDPNGGAPFSITIDGVTVNGTTAQNTATTGQEIKSFTWLQTLSRTEHVVEIRNTNGANTWGSVIFCGVYLNNGDATKGVQIYDGSQSGWAAYLFNQAPSQIAQAYGLVQPDLVTIEFGYNDAGHGNTSAQFKTDLSGVISAISSACVKFGKDTRFLLIGGYDPGDAQYGNPNKPAGSWPEPWQNYLNVMQQLATENSKVAFADLSVVMPRISDDTTGLYDGAIHPSDKGHALMARILRGVVSPVVSQNRLASARVTASANTQKSGLVLAGSSKTADWASGDSCTASAYVKAPNGAKLVLSVACAPGTTTSTNITGTGDWQRVVTTSNYTGTPTAVPSVNVVTADNTQPSYKFWVCKVQIEKGKTASAYFDGYSPNGTEVYDWTGDAYVSSSTASLSNTYGVVVPSGGKASTSKSVIRYNPTSTYVDTTSASASYAAWPISISSGTWATGVCWVNPAVSSQFSLAFTKGGAIVSPTYQVNALAGQWTEIRTEGTLTADADAIRITCNVKGGFYVAEMTAVSSRWSGSSFSGSSKNSEGIQCSWAGGSDASRSMITYANSNYIAVGNNFFGSIATADSPVQLVTSMGIDGGNCYEWLWASDGCYTSNNRALVMYPAVSSEASVTSGWNFGFNGSFYIAEFDLGAKRLLNFKMWARDPRGGKSCINWGNAMCQNRGYIYIFGSRVTPDNNMQNNNYLCRISGSNLMTGATTEVWTSAGWKATTVDPGQWELSASTTPAVIATTPGAGFSSVRVWQEKWKALVMGGLSRDLTMYTADAASGTWLYDSSLYTLPSSKLLGYSPKWQTSADKNNEGFAALICESSGDSVANPSLYIPVWLRGPSGTGSALNGMNWIDHSETNETRFVYGDLKPGSVYAIRVRAVDNANPPNYSAWVGSDPIIVAKDTTPPNKPSAPTVVPFFQGARVVWDGRDESGNGMPLDFDRFEVHISTDQSFVPTSSTLIDTMRTQGGVSPIQGLNYGITYWVCLVAYDTSGNASLPSDAVAVTPQRLSDPDLPDKLITGAKIADKAINVSNLTVGAFSNNLVPNGNMEDAGGSGNVLGWSGYFTEDPVVDKTAPIAGNSSMAVSVTGSTRMFLSTAVPITPGAVYYISAKIRTDRPLDKASVTVLLAVANTESNAGSGFGNDIRLGNVGSTGGLAISTLEGQCEIPWDDTIKFGRVVISCDAETMPYKVWVDDVELRKIVGEAALANASINSAKIKNLAVDDSKIANLSVGKVTAGRIYADWVQSGRLMTPPDASGSWSLMDSVGFHTYKDAAGSQRTFDTSNGNVWLSGILEGSEIRGGTAYFPSQYANVPGRVSLSEQGLVVDAVPTVNLCPNPSLENPQFSGWISSSSNFELKGAAIYDYSGNIDIVSYNGRSSLKVWSTQQSGFFDVMLGGVYANTYYTASWYSAPTNIDDTPTSWSSVYGDFSNMGIIRNDNSTQIATGRSGYLVREGALQGLWNQPLSSGIDVIAIAGGWNMRTFLTFKTPADIPAGTKLRLRLPMVRTKDNGNESTAAVCYDGIQLEQQPWMTRYVDGDQPGCTWDGTPHNSTSRRNYVRSLWAPTQDDPVLQASVRAPRVDTRRIKIGSGILHGSNAVETLMGNGWDLWSSGNGTWYTITWDNSYQGLNARYTSDDGVMFPKSGSGSNFYAVTGGLYTLSASITFPKATQTGAMGLRLRHMLPGAKAASIVAETYKPTNTPGEIVSVSWSGWSPAGWYFYWEAFQTTQSGSASMFAHTGATPCRASMIQFA